jgi:hypothetical protein
VLDAFGVEDEGAVLGDMAETAGRRAEDVGAGDVAAVGDAAGLGDVF